LIKTDEPSRNKDNSMTDGTKIINDDDGTLPPVLGNNWNRPK